MTRIFAGGGGGEEEPFEDEEPLWSFCKSPSEEDAGDS